jgi:hypothetical protein
VLSVHADSSQACPVNNGINGDIISKAGVAPLRGGQNRGSMGHLTEMGNHRVGSGNSSRLPRYAAAADQDTAGR